MKKQSEEEVKTEAEKEELGRRIGELEEEMERVEELKRKIQKQEWSEEGRKLKEEVIKRMRSV